MATITNPNFNVAINEIWQFKGIIDNQFDSSQLNVTPVLLCITIV